MPMLGLMANMFKIPDLRKKIVFTLAMVGVYRIGAHIPVPFIDAAAMREFWMQATGGAAGGLMKMVDMFSGGAFRQMTIFALGIMPYISASIILQLLQVVWPWLEKIAKEGEAGRKKINQYTRYGTVLLAAFQSFGVSIFLLSERLTLINEHRILFSFTTVLAITAGTCFIMWLGERITEKGIGNGISLIIAVGIIASYPYSAAFAVNSITMGQMAPIVVPVILILFVAVSVAIIYMQLGARKIPVQYAKRVVGRRMMSGATSHLPLKVNTAGVIPIIFSSAIMSFPGLVFGGFVRRSESQGGGFLAWLGEFFSMDSTINPYQILGLETGGIFHLLRSVNMYLLIYSILTIFFCYFYTAVIFNPIDIADNLKKSGGFIPGRRPGKATSEYIDYVLTRITLVGSVFLVIVAVLPQIITVSYRVDWNITNVIGGTGLIIVIGVLLDTMKQIESQLMMRHYEGFRWRRGRGGYRPSGARSPV
jgi:preprotein translocase subunit SecY